MKRLLFPLMAAALLWSAPACSNNDPNPDPDPSENPADRPDEPDVTPPDKEPGEGIAADDGDAPGVDPAVIAWNGTKATDAADDRPGTDADIYWEANNFDKVVTVTWNGASASVDNPNPAILVRTDGAYVTVDFKTNKVAGVKIVAKGSSADGALKIYGKNKAMLSLRGLDLTSKRGPALNSQCKKRLFVDIAAGSANRLTDVAEYGDDPYYLDPALAAEEDRKGCFFSEGNLIFSGTGTLEIRGRHKHGLAVDGSMTTRPGVTLAVTEAADNAFQIKGDATDLQGLRVIGGYLYALTKAPAGKAVKTDLGIRVDGGSLCLNTTGGSVYDDVAKDTSSPACIKTDGEAVFTGGSVVMRSTGDGGKGLNAAGNIMLLGARVEAVTSGGRYTHASAITSSPKAVKTDADILLDGGSVTAVVLGGAEGGEALEAKGSFKAVKGSVTAYSHDDAVNVGKDMNVLGADVYAYSVANDAIDVNGTLTVGSGNIVAIGGSAPESGIDVDHSGNFRIDGGTVVSFGGSMKTEPSASSAQASADFTSCSAARGLWIAVLDADAKPLLALKAPRSLDGGSFMFSAPALKAGASYSVVVGGTPTGAATLFDCLATGGTWASDAAAAVFPFTQSSVVTVF